MKKLIGFAITIFFVSLLMLLDCGPYTQDRLEANKSLVRQVVILNKQKIQNLNIYSMN